MIKCVVTKCNNNITTGPHHIFCGNGTRKISDKYGFISGLCFVCHKAAHNDPIQYYTPLKGRSPKVIERYLLMLLGKGYDYNKVRRAVNNHYKPDSRMYLDHVTAINGVSNEL